MAEAPLPVGVEELEVEVEEEVELTLFPLESRGAEMLVNVEHRTQRSGLINYRFQ